MYDAYAESCFSKKKKNVNKRAKHGFVQNTVHGVETHWLSRKEKVMGTAVRKESHADSLLRHERNPSPVDFIEKKMQL